MIETLFPANSKVTAVLGFTAISLFQDRSNSSLSIIPLSSAMNRCIVCRWTSIFQVANVLYFSVASFEWRNCTFVCNGHTILFQNTDQGKIGLNLARITDVRRSLGRVEVLEVSRKAVTQAYFCYNERGSVSCRFRSATLALSYATVVHLFKSVRPQISKRKVKV